MTTRAPRPSAARGPAVAARHVEDWSTARSRTLRVAETFVSLQGEGRRAGLPTAFIRLTGCALRCRWCDTAWAFHEGTRRRLEDIEQEVLATGISRVCITGGEPLLQPSVVPLARRLAEVHGLDVVVETGGDQDVSVLPPSVARIMDIKLPGSGMADRMDLRNLERLGPRDEVKLVVADRRDWEAACALVRGPLARFPGEVVVSPVAGELSAQELARWVLDERLGVRVQVQLHKLLWPDRTRGV
ncbi:MAG: radical SAM protein [Acidobacteria bacterium]|nr:MAG: radical SAM protein [Acidobacteriota bacterium]